MCLKKDFGLYIHTPFCLQRCHYCDFATFTLEEASTNIDDYINYLCIEIKKGSEFIENKKLRSIYFGGGTPSLLELAHFEKIFKELSQNGFSRDPQTEVTLEINPATLDEVKIRALKQLGVNRYSVGAQTFNAKHLKNLNRKHSAKDTIDTLSLLSELDCNYSFDLLFALPNQSCEELKEDLTYLNKFNPSHISPYYLTLPTNHFLNINRPQEEDEIKMFGIIYDELLDKGYSQYEISNFSKPQKESKHNLIYWTDQDYWGVGLSSHSYLSRENNFGVRFSNPKTFQSYYDWVSSWQPKDSLINDRRVENFEILNQAQSLTDYCHTFLRMKQGIAFDQLVDKFGPQRAGQVWQIAESISQSGWVVLTPDRLFLSKKGQMLSNQVFLNFTFINKFIR